MGENEAVILVVDDDNSHREMLTAVLGNWGYAVKSASDGAQAIEKVRQSPFDLVLMDIRMFNISGIEALVGIKKMNPAIPVVLMTAYASVETAISAMKTGAYDYLTKPLDFDELRLLISRALEHSRLRVENANLKRQFGEPLGGMVGSSEPIRRLKETITIVAPTDATVLIFGESGTGKELVASALHQNSPRREGAFVKINCAAIAENLLEAELFGHEKGAFTGAEKRRVGRFEQANGGSIFLDELGEMSLAMQAKLLRVLQEREINRVGSGEAIKVDVRVIAATNKDLMAMVEAGAFREDLFYRLSVVMLKVPPLRERREDVVVIAQAYLQKFAQAYKKEVKGFTPQAFDKINKCTWRGNVRELINTVERAVVLSRGEYIDHEEIIPATVEFSSAENATDAGKKEEGACLLKDVEKNTIITAMATFHGNKSEVARKLGITRRTLHKKLQEYELA
ncbi:MAG: sigma-54 dependent transcriptional regulator [Deltaproteobacteria bacterium]|nr:sigma-54 dependent transcriptional regulator [Deltaproteobacteria bacterium]